MRVKSIYAFKMDETWGTSARLKRCARVFIHTPLAQLLQSEPEKRSFSAITRSVFASRPPDIWQYQSGGSASLLTITNLPTICQWHLIDNRRAWNRTNACVNTPSRLPSECERSPVLWITVPEAFGEGVARYLQLRDLKSNPNGSLNRDAARAFPFRNSGVWFLVTVWKLKVSGGMKLS